MEVPLRKPRDIVFSEDRSSILPLPGGEGRGAAKVNRAEDLPFRLEHLLGTPILKTMSRAARALGKPEAAADVCQAVCERA